MGRLTTVIVCDTDQEPAVVTIDGDDPTDIQDRVGGYFTPVPRLHLLHLSPDLLGFTVYVNEDGDRLGLPANPLVPGTVGPAVITKTTDDGIDVGLTSGQVQAVLLGLNLRRFAFRR